MVGNLGSNPIDWFIVPGTTGKRKFQQEIAPLGYGFGWAVNPNRTSKRRVPI